MDIAPDRSLVYRLYIRTDTFCVTVPQSLSFVPCNTARRYPMGQLCDAIKRRPAASAGAARPRAFTSSLSSHPGPIVGLRGNLDHPLRARLSLFLIERKLRHNEHFGSRNAHRPRDTCTSAASLLEPQNCSVVNNVLKTRLLL